MAAVGADKPQRSEIKFLMYRPELTAGCRCEKQFAHSYRWRMLIVLEVLAVWLIWVRGGHSDILVRADYAHYAYGLPILWALLLAGG